MAKKGYVKTISQTTTDPEKKDFNGSVVEGKKETIMAKADETKKKFQNLKKENKPNRRL